MSDRYAHQEAADDAAACAAEIAWLTLFAERTHGHAPETVESLRAAFVASFVRAALPARASEVLLPRDASAWIVHVGSRHGAIWARSNVLQHRARQ